MRPDRAGTASNRMLFVAALAVLYTLLNAFKPVHIDDTAYFYYAAQMAHKPLDPYGFDIFWYEAPQPASTVLAPPLLPYWWSLAIRLFGTSVFLWKIWLFPFAWLFVWSLDALFHRWARGLEAPLTVMTVLSPTFLPSLNLMLDVPALALSLTALVLFFRSVDRGSLAQAAAAGLVAGLAMQTKYTAFLAPAVMFLYVLLRGSSGKLFHWVLAAGIAAAVFVAWECFVASQYKVSHFLWHYQQESRGLAEKVRDYSLPFVVLLGGLAPFTSLLGVAGMGWRGRWTLGAASLIGLGFGSVAVFDLGMVLSVNPQAVYIPWEWFLFLFFGAFVLVVLGGVLKISTRFSKRGIRLWRRHSVDWFLLLWLGMEVAGYFALNPFVASRRVMGVVVVVTLIFGRLASLTCRSSRRRTLVWSIAGANVLLGLVFYGTDLREAFVRKAAAEDAAAWIRRQDPNARIWFVGHWGFQYYAEAAGMTPVVPGLTRLEKNDWLLVPDGYIHQQSIGLTDKPLEQEGALAFDDWLPWRSVWVFYGNPYGIPLEHRRGERLRIAIYRATAAFVPG